MKIHIYYIYKGEKKEKRMGNNERENEGGKNNDPL
jgi:hypothetical protein